MGEVRIEWSTDLMDNINRPTFEVQYRFLDRSVADYWRGYGGIAYTPPGNSSWGGWSGYVKTDGGALAMQHGEVLCPVGGCGEIPSDMVEFRIRTTCANGVQSDWSYSWDPISVRRRYRLPIN